MLAATEAAAAENPVLLPKHFIAEQSKVHHRHECDDRVGFGIKFEREFSIIIELLWLPVEFFFAGFAGVLLLLV